MCKPFLPRILEYLNFWPSWLENTCYILSSNMTFHKEHYATEVELGWLQAEQSLCGPVGGPQACPYLSLPYSHLRLAADFGPKTLSVRHLQNRYLCELFPNLPILPVTLYGSVLYKFLQIALTHQLIQVMPPTTSEQQWLASSQKAWRAWKATNHQPPSSQEPVRRLTGRYNRFPGIINLSIFCAVETLLYYHFKMGTRVLLYLRNPLSKQKAYIHECGKCLEQSDSICICGTYVHTFITSLLNYSKQKGRSQWDF